MAALAEVEQMMGNVAPGTPEGDRFDLLVTLIAAYEDVLYLTPMSRPQSDKNKIER